MDVSTLLDEAKGPLSARRVFSDPIEKDGTTVVLAAMFGGGAGGGQAPVRAQGPEAAKEAKEGSGGGFGVRAKPAGAFVIRQGKVRWQPAVDVNRIILGGQLVAVAGLLLARALIKRSEHRAGRR